MTDPKERESLYNESENFIRFFIFILLQRLAKNSFENFEKIDYSAFFYLPRKLIFLRSF